MHRDAVSKPSRAQQGMYMRDRDAILQSAGQLRCVGQRFRNRGLTERFPMIRRPTCPICNKQLALDEPQQSSAFPFCSDRCRDVDFFRWHEGKYAIIEPLTAEHLESELESEDGQALA